MTNPLTMGPIYYLAWHLGGAILGDPVAAPPELGSSVEDGPSNQSWWQRATRRILGVGKPLLFGLAVMASTVGIATFFLVSAAWRLSVLWKRHRRRR